MRLGLGHGPDRQYGGDVAAPRSRGQRRSVPVGGRRKNDSAGVADRDARAIAALLCSLAHDLLAILGLDDGAAGGSRFTPVRQITVAVAESRGADGSAKP